MNPLLQLFSVRYLLLTYLTNDEKMQPRPSLKLRPHEQTFSCQFFLDKKKLPCWRVNLVKVASSNHPGWKLGYTVFQPATRSPSNENLLVWTATDENLPKIYARIQFHSKSLKLWRRIVNKPRPFCFDLRYWRQMAARLSKEKMVARPHEPVSLSQWTSLPCHGKLLVWTEL